jgi:hypothetical protein
MVIIHYPSLDSVLHSGAILCFRACPSWRARCRPPSSSAAAWCASAGPRRRAACSAMTSFSSTVPASTSRQTSTPGSTSSASTPMCLCSSRMQSLRLCRRYVVVVFVCHVSVGFCLCLSCGLVCVFSVCIFLWSLLSLSLIVHVDGLKIFHQESVISLLPIVYDIF